MSLSGFWDWLGIQRQNGHSGQVHGFGLRDLMRGNKVALWNRWRMMMEPEDEAKFRVPIKGMNDDMMEHLKLCVHLLGHCDVRCGGNWILDCF